MCIMAIAEFKQRAAAKRRAIERRISACDPSDRELCERLVRDAARVAFEQFFPLRFGAFRGRARIVVTVNMGAENQAARDRFRRRLEQLGVAELGVAVWPPGARFTWAVLMDHPDAERWIAEARQAWFVESR